jgi:hypothetical protein
MTTETGVNVDTAGPAGAGRNLPVSDAEKAAATAAANTAIAAAGVQAPPAMTPAEARAEIAKLKGDRKFGAALIAG